MSDKQIMYLVVGVAGLISLGAWIALVVVPAWAAYWRMRDRLLAMLMSVYVLAAFVLVGVGVGGLFLWYYDRL
jgi:hypothetical protein